MNNFEYAQPRNLTELLDLLDSQSKDTEFLGGGTDLVGLMKRAVVAPERVVNLNDVEEMRSIDRDESTGEIVIGAAVHLGDILGHVLLEPFEALHQAIRGLSSLQFQSQSTLGGELLRRPRCWYFRSGHGLLAANGKMVVEGDNRFHAILGNSGPAKFVNASRLAPALIALRAKARMVGPKSSEQRDVPLEELYRTPRREGQRENVLKPGQVLSHILLADVPGQVSAAYEVRHGEGPDDPLAAAAASLVFGGGGVVQQARIVLGQVAPVPLFSEEAARAIVGQPVNQYTAESAGAAAVTKATPLSDNRYKVQLAKVAVKRAILQAASLPTGGAYA